MKIHPDNDPQYGLTLAAVLIGAVLAWMLAWAIWRATL